MQSIFSGWGGYDLVTHTDGKVYIRLRVTDSRGRYGVSNYAIHMAPFRSVTVKFKTPQASSRYYRTGTVLICKTSIKPDNYPGSYFISGNTGRMHGSGSDGNGANGNKEVTVDVSAVNEPAFLVLGVSSDHASDESEDGTLFVEYIRFNT